MASDSDFPLMILFYNFLLKERNIKMSRCKEKVFRK